jgi:TrmH family RNA methyltransferase
MKESNNMTNPSIVLVETENSGNIGSVCRIIRNFGFDELLLVNPCKIDTTECKKMALENFDIALKAKIYKNLNEISNMFDIMVAFSRRKGQKRISDGYFHNFLKNLFYNEKTHNKRMAFVFGRESSGLTKEELLECNFIVELLTNKENGSLNLSHSVAIACYEFLRATEFLDKKINEKIYYEDFTIDIWNKLNNLLEDISFYDIDEKEYVEKKISSILKKSFLNEVDKNYIIKVIEKVRRLFLKN